MKNIITLLIIIIALAGCQSKIEKVSKGTSIAIQPFEGFESSYSYTVKQTLEDMYGVQVDVLEEIDVPQFAFVNIKSPRYRADTLIRYLRANELYANYDYVIGLIKEDISTTKYEDFKTKKIKSPETKYQDWGVFGLGYCPGKSCIVSSYRLLKSTSKENFIERLKKVSCHELGHNFGLPHCPNKECIMQDAAESIKTVDDVELHLCDNCRKKIRLTN